MDERPGPPPHGAQRLRWPSGGSPLSPEAAWGVGRRAPRCSKVGCPSHHPCPRLGQSQCPSERPRSVIVVGHVSYGAFMNVGMAAPFVAEGRRRASIDADVLQRAIGSLQTRGLAAVLYGSYARGTATHRSDIDVLQLVRSRPGSDSRGNVNITRYFPKALQAMAQRGSLFVLHLRLDAYIIHDDEELFSEALAAYRAPHSYDPLYDELRRAAIAIQPAADSPRYLARLQRLGVYLLRTALYARLAEQGRPTFDVMAACQEFGSDEVRSALQSRHIEVSSTEQLRSLVLGIESIIGPIDENQFDSVEGLAVQLAGDDRLSSQLVTSLLTSTSTEIDYAHLLPPIL